MSALPRITLFVLCVLFGFTGCTLPQNADVTPLPSPLNPTTIQSATEPPTPTVTSDTWQLLLPGLEQRIYDAEGSAQLLVLRVDPSLFTFRAHYSPGDARPLDTWQAQLPDAEVIINANFFDEDNRVLGLLVADGQNFGVPYRDRGGLFYVQNGLPGIRSNVTQPYNGEVFEQAVQAFPMLVLDGAQVYTNRSRTARRTAIAVDTQGRVILLVTRRGGLSLAALSAFLVEADMDIVRAFNLDGGGSTMMAVNAGETAFQVDTFDAVPVVLAVYARSG